MTKTRQWTVFTAIAVILVLVAGWFLLVKPQSAKANNLHAQAASQQESNKLLVTQIAALEAEQRQLPQQQQELAKFATQVPSDASEPAVIRQLTATAAGAGVDMISMTPGAATVVAASGTTAGAATVTTPSAATGTLVQLPLSIGFTGSYANVESFFQGLEKLPRALLVTSWSLCPDGGASGAGSSGGVSCSLPPTPSNKTLPAGTLGGTLSAVVFYAPPVSTTTTPSTGTVTTPAPATSTAPSPAASTTATPAPTAASSAPAN
jgi:Tfp pilus assembly protein PilO